MEQTYVIRTLPRNFDLEYFTNGCCYQEECIDKDPCDLNRDLSSTNTSVEIDVLLVFT